jgi:hypothetical protein
VSDQTFDEVKVGQLRWVPFHSWGDGVDQIDARFVDADGRPVGTGCDVWALDVLRAECEAPVVAAAHAAEAMWAAGTVCVVDASLLGATSLIVPGAELTRAGVLEALSRFAP